MTLFAIAPGEYGRCDVHVNTVEGFYSVFKRGMKGVYQHCSERHLHRYVAEFDFRYNHRMRLGVDDLTLGWESLEGHCWQAAHILRANKELEAQNGHKGDSLVAEKCYIRCAPGGDFEPANPAGRRSPRPVRLPISPRGHGVERAFRPAPGCGLRRC